MKEDCHPWLCSPPSHRVPSCRRVTPLQLSHLLFSRRVVAALFPLLQVRGIGLVASSGHGVTAGSAPQLLHQVPEHLSRPLVLFRAFPTMNTWSLDLEMFGLWVRHLYCKETGMGRLALKCGNVAVSPVSSIPLS